VVVRIPVSAEYSVSVMPPKPNTSIYSFTAFFEFFLVKKVLLFIFQASETSGRPNTSFGRIFGRIVGLIRNRIFGIGNATKTKYLYLQFYGIFWCFFGQNGTFVYFLPVFFVSGAIKPIYNSLCKSQAHHNPYLWCTET
jgi:hypothetical protein